jgi:hypothetical protein
VTSFLPIFINPTEIWQGLLNTREIRIQSLNGEAKKQKGNSNFKGHRGVLLFLSSERFFQAHALSLRSYPVFDYRD